MKRSYDSILKGIKKHINKRRRKKENRRKSTERKRKRTESNVQCYFKAEGNKFVSCLVCLFCNIFTKLFHVTPSPFSFISFSERPPPPHPRPPPHPIESHFLACSPKSHQPPTLCLVKNEWTLTALCENNTRITEYFAMYDVSSTWGLNRHTCM